MQLSKQCIQVVLLLHMVVEDVKDRICYIAQ